MNCLQFFIVFVREPEVRLRLLQACLLHQKGILLNPFNEIFNYLRNARTLPWEHLSQHLKHNKIETLQIVGLREGLTHFKNSTNLPAACGLPSMSTERTQRIGLAGHNSPCGLVRSRPGTLASYLCSSQSCPAELLASLSTYWLNVIVEPSVLVELLNRFEHLHLRR